MKLASTMATVIALLGIFEGVSGVPLWPPMKTEAHEQHFNPTSAPAYPEYESMFN
ncbi:hypothetical protein PGT21_021541 [Puccinia graminis f. sp. tritici]|uniref:Uncharacterized protein n=1 Tax=Puccinia graminis f. sp. tritici TaxID=56615 RepID=A0A5B0LV07_PUCGR|nr:hypothetical protein PGT21_021541 [Puccinia graminis f. sp. tritici]KAA1091732.1 hypothetical protein PGTUg99_007026 [Puccinia graminis f. sp. tritici]KAA1118406.1 hypothetical protein PGTUg99_006067 [Puccinia graminis f. sp. tritici]